MPKPKTDPERIFSCGQMTKKSLYKITVNWYGQIFKMYKWANSESRLITYISKDLAPLVELEWNKVRNILLNETKEMYKVELVSGPER